MTDELKDCGLTDEDLRAALREMRTYMDITEEDLRKIYLIALRHAKKRLAAGIPVRAVMTTDVITVTPHADIHEVARLLAEHRISGLPVVDGEGCVIGIVTEADVLSVTGMKRGHTFRDIVRHLLGEPLPERKGLDKVAHFMTSPAIAIRPEADIKEAAKVLDAKRIKRLPVTDDENRLIGIISRADIVRSAAKQ
ncbi:MAG: CBS domain-containing protein [Nitrospirae bacterium]|nr:CBS domain-containing protein [Nitrospirota bacterium]